MKKEREREREKERKKECVKEKERVSAVFRSSQGRGSVYLWHFVTVLTRGRKSGLLLLSKIQIL